MSFTRKDLTRFGRLLKRADEVVAMREVYYGEHHPNVMALRHDVDNTLDAVLELATWEKARGYRSTYFILHDSPYWDDPGLPLVLEELASLGHEIGLHANGIAEALRQHDDPARIIERALERLRGWGHNVIGSVAHGDELCYHKKQLRFVNDEMFTECIRPEMGEPRRMVDHVRIEPRPLADFGLLYDSYRLPRALYLSDSGGTWSGFGEANDGFPSPDGQLHILQHPCWWVQAFSSKEVKA